MEPAAQPLVSAVVAVAPTATFARICPVQIPLVELVGPAAIQRPCRMTVAAAVLAAGDWSLLAAATLDRSTTT
jgi:hypothetical protein